MNIESKEQFVEMLSGSPFIGYPYFFVMVDCGVLCPHCAEREKDLIVECMTDNSETSWDKQWVVVAVDINYEDESLYCDHCNKQIVSAYGEGD